MNNQECKVRPGTKDINSNEPSFYCLNVVVIIIISMIHMQNYVFLMLVKT